MMSWRRRSGAVRKGMHTAHGQTLVATLPLLGLRVMLSALALLVLIAVLHGMTTLRDAPVTTLEVFGYSGAPNSAKGISEAEVRDMLQRHMASGFWQLDLHAVQSSIESHQWVRRAIVQREWPGKLTVQIDEHLPVARWNASHVLASSGELIAVESLVEFIDMPQIATPGEGAHSREEIIALVEQYNRLQKMLAAQHKAIRELGSSLGSDVWLVIEGDTRIELGQRDHELRLARLVDLVEAGVIASWESIEHADMRYPAGIAVRWRKMEGSEQIAIESPVRGAGAQGALGTPLRKPCSAVQALTAKQNENCHA